MSAEPLSDILLAAIRRRRARITELPWEYEQPFAMWQVYSQARRRRRDTVADAAHSGLWDIICQQHPEHLRRSLHRGSAVRL